MPQYKQSDNAEITEIIRSSKNSSETIEALSDDVYLITLPGTRTINSFFLNLVLEKEDYDYGVAYVDILQESDLNTDHNRQFNTYVFFFEKNSDNTVNQLLDVNDYIYINFLPHPAFNINRTQNFNRLKDDDLIYVPVFPEQEDVVKDGYYLPLFPLNLNDINNISNVVSQKDIDYYEVQSDEKKRHINITEIYDIFSDRDNIKLFEENILDNFGSFPMGMFGTQIQNDIPYLFHLPSNNFTDVEGNKPLAQTEYDAIFNSSTQTLATKSNLNNSAIMRYITLTNKNTKTIGGIDGKYIKVSIDYYSKETELNNTISLSDSTVEDINPYQDFYLNAGVASKDSLMAVQKVNGSGQPILIDVYIKDSTGSETENTITEFNFTINNTSESDLAEATPDNVSQKISKNSKLGSDINAFMDNFDPRFNVNSSNIDNYFIVGYEYIDASKNNITFTGYTKDSNQTQNISISTDTYSKFKVRIIWN